MNEDWVFWASTNERRQTHTHTNNKGKQTKALLYIKRCEMNDGAYKAEACVCMQ